MTDKNVLFDYVTVSFPVDESEEEYRIELDDSIRALFVNEHFQFFQKLLNLDTKMFTDGGKIQHYQKLITFGENIHFKYKGPKNGSDQVTHSLEMKGEGCREAEKRGIDWYAFFAYIYEHDLNVSTLHIACDVFTTNYFTTDQLLKKTKNEDYISFSRKTSYIESTSTNRKSGLSIYFGARDSNQINIYDKKNERYYKGYDVDTNTWIRFEIRLKSKTFHFIRLLVLKGLKTLPQLYFEVLTGMLEFKTREQTNKNNKERWKIWRPWERFVGDIQKITLKNQAKLESTITTKRDWLKRSAGIALIQHLTTATEEEKQEFLEEIIEEKLERLDNKHLTQVNEERKKKGLPEFDDLPDYIDHIKTIGLKI